MSDSQETILIELMAECADRVLAGGSTVACLERYPEHASALEPLLSAVLDVHRLRQVPARSAAVKAASRAKFLAGAQTLLEPAESTGGPVAQRGKWWRGLPAWLGGTPGARGLPQMMPSGLAAALVIIVLAGLLLTGMVSASASALPGNLLYPVKTATERVQVLLTFDLEDRERLLDELAQRRIDEAKAVVDQERRVASMALQGTIEAIAGNTWLVSGLTVTITPDSVIVGTPVLGGRVQGSVRAPGTGALIVRYAEVEPPEQIQPAAPPATPTPTPASTPTRPLATPTAMATITDPISPGGPGASGPHARPIPYYEPTDQPAQAATSTSIPTATVTLTATATRTPTLTTTPTVTATPTPPRDPVTGRIVGRVLRIVGGWWTIDEITVETNPETRFIGDPTVGSRVEAIVIIQPGGAAVALTITEIEPPGGPPEPLEFTDIVQAIDDGIWTIGGRQVIVSSETVLVNDPGVGDLVTVVAERYSDGQVRALRITAISEVMVYFDGIIEAMDGDTWRIGGYLVVVTADTQIIGEPTIGALAQVAALQLPDRSLIARIIAVIAPAPTATATPTPSATP